MNLQRSSRRPLNKVPVVDCCALAEECGVVAGSKSLIALWAEDEEGPNGERAGKKHMWQFGCPCCTPGGDDGRGKLGPMI